MVHTHTTRDAEQFLSGWVAIEVVPASRRNLGRSKCVASTRDVDTLDRGKHTTNISAQQQPLSMSVASSVGGRLVRRAPKLQTCWLPERLSWEHNLFYSHPGASTKHGVLHRETNRNTNGNCACACSGHVLDALTDRELLRVWVERVVVHAELELLVVDHLGETGRERR